MQKSAQGHVQALNEMAALQASQSTEDASAEAARRESFAELCTRMEGQEASVQNCQDEAQALAEVMGPALERLATLSGKVCEDVRSGAERHDAAVVELAAKASQAQIFAERMSADAAGVIRRGADTVEGAAEAQSQASAVFAQTQQAQWEELEGVIGASLREISGAVENSVKNCNDGATSGLDKVREQRRLAGDALGKGRDATEELIRGCSGTLARQLAQVKAEMAGSRAGAGGNLTVFTDDELLTDDSFLQDPSLDSYMQGPEQEQRILHGNKAGDKGHGNGLRWDGAEARPLRQLQQLEPEGN